MADNVIGLREVEEDLAVPISVGHLRAIPEGVVVAHAVVNRRHQRHAGIVNRVPVKALPIEIDDAPGGIERAFRRDVHAFTGIRDRRAGQRPSVFAVVDRDRRDRREYTGNLERGDPAGKKTDLDRLGLGVSQSSPRFLDRDTIAHGLSRLDRDRFVFGEPAQDTWWNDEATVTSTHDVTPLRTNGFGCSMPRGRGYRRCPRKWPRLVTQL